MFQYAAGYSLASRLKVGLKIDVEDYSQYKLHHGYELKRIFNLQESFASQLDVRNLLKWQSNPYVRKALSREIFSPFRCESYIKEPHYNYWTGFEDLRSNTYLDGYWQSERYFSECSREIRKIFKFKTPLDFENNELMASIDSSNSVSLHVRRGDYVSKKNLSIHGVCSMDYYDRAISYISEKVKKPVFFIFTDDYDWVSNNISLPTGAVYVKNNIGVNSFRDMQLMSLCKHNILANSSFSWWAAWLNVNLDRIVVAPKKWFADGRNVDDVTPKNWIII